MRFRSHQRWFPKDVEFPREYEDAYCVSEKHGRVAVADGVSSAIFSRRWARLLVNAAVMAPPDFAYEASVQAWLTPLQQSWRSEINFASLPWHQKPKAMSIGAQSTLVCLELVPGSLGEESAEHGHEIKITALGDCVVFLIRNNEKLFSFPLVDSSEFAAPPQIFSSIARGVSYVEHITVRSSECLEGDLVVVCSDAVGLWAMQ